MPSRIEGSLDRSMIKTLTRISGFVKPFAGLLVLVIVLNSVFSALSALSIAVIKPIFQLLFEVIRLLVSGLLLSLVYQNTDLVHM